MLCYIGHKDVFVGKKKIVCFLHGQTHEVSLHCFLRRALGSYVICENGSNLFPHGFCI